MINTLEKDFIIRVLGSKYSPKILNHFKKFEITNAHNEFFSSDSIRKIVGGFQENLEIEHQIMDYVTKQFESQKLLQKQREKKLKKLQK